VAFSYLLEIARLPAMADFTRALMKVGAGRPRSCPPVSPGAYCCHLALPDLGVPVELQLGNRPKLAQHCFYTCCYTCCCCATLIELLLAASSRATSQPKVARGSALEDNGQRIRVKGLGFARLMVLLFVQRADHPG